MVGEHRDGIKGGMASVARHRAESAAVVDDRLTATAGDPRSRFTVYVDFAADAGEAWAVATVTGYLLGGAGRRADLPCSAYER